MTTSVRTASAVRREFLDYFAKKHAHTIVPSAPVVPLNDPTLLFTNAGMNQFKDVFLGQGEREYTRAVDTQKCIRAGGKHNDLEDVGRDTYHHTFFEMLGNWSFGDYFKAEAIEWAWDLLTNIWGLDPERLHVTVFGGDDDDGLDADDEAAELWARYVPESRIQRFGKKDNFWEMGETGPCGPCSEIHYDATPDKSGTSLVNADDPRVVEIWNLVFIQFNRGPGGVLTPLPAKHVDTGMGFERIVRVLQDAESNYDTDIFAPIFGAIQSETGAREYSSSLNDPVDVAYRVIADHVRCLTVAIADGANPSNEGRGYVLRRILRRAVRHAHQTLGMEGAVLHKLVPSVIESLNDAFPELDKHERAVVQTIHREEVAFLKTIARGIELFEEAVGRAQNGRVSADDAFKLHDTYGFPIDLTRVMAEERGMTVDEGGFNTLMEEAREKSRQTEGVGVPIDLSPDAIAKLKHLGVGPTDDSEKYDAKPVSSEVAAIWNGTDFDNHAEIGRRVAIITDRTCFYAEQGGQVGDVGFILSNTKPGQVGGWGYETRMPKGAARFRVDEVKRSGDYVLHIGQTVDGTLNVEDRVMIDVKDDHRNPTKWNHTATHLLNHALRQVLGEEVQQKGSLVAPDRLRFDYSFGRALTAHEINAVERLINAAIHQKMPVHAEDVPLELAERITGVRAVFGEKYPDPVRVVSVGPSIDRLATDPDLPRWRECAIEFCGGTHVQNTAEIRRCTIIAEQALAVGIRRIIAVTGPAALAAEGAGKELEARCYRAKALSGTDLIEEANDISRQIDELTIGIVAKNRIREELDRLRDRAKDAQKEHQAAARTAAVDQARVIAENIQGRILVEQVSGAESDVLLAAMDVLKARRPEAAAMLIAGDEAEGKVAIVARVPDEMIKVGLKAGDWVREAAKMVGGSGGGRPDMAQAGGKDPARINEAIQHAKVFAEEALKS